MRLRHRVLAGLAAASAAAVLAPSALASSTPTLALGQYNGTSSSSSTPAGSTSNLALNLAFANSTSGGTVDSPNALTINLPSGLLTNTSIKTTTGSQCITVAASSSPNSGCEIGTGVVDAQANLSVTLPILGTLTTIPITVAVNVGYYLTAPPAGSTGDLAGLEVFDATNPSVTALAALPLGVTLPVIPALGQIGNTGDILIRSTDAGATIKLTGIPNTTDGLPLSINAINSTFDRLRFPTTCGAQSVSVATTSYAGDAHTVSGGLSVASCSSLAYNPKFSASATRDSADGGVAVTTAITQTATEAPNSAVALTFPTTMFGPNLNTIKNLCTTTSTAGCNPVGSVSATSPLYPNTLSGSAYLVGGTANGNAVSLKLVFPSPFPITLTGKVNLTTNSAAFTGLPDIPLTDLQVTLRGGSDSLFVATCRASSGTASAALTAQNGATKALTSPISYTGCPADNPPRGTSTGTGTGTGTKTGTGTGSGSGAGSGSGSSSTSSGSGSTTVTPTATAKMVSQSISGLAVGKPSLTFRVAAGKKAAKLTRLTIKLPSGLSFRSHKKGKKHLVKGVTLRGTASRSATLKGKKLVVVFKAGSRKVTVRLGTKALKESKALRLKAQKKALKSLVLRVTARNTKHKSKALKAKITKLNLG